MRAFQLIPAVVSSLVLLSQHAAASPMDMEGGNLDRRGCSNPCGFYSQLCCTSGQTCITNGGQAVCSDSGSGDGDYDYHTTTWTETDTKTYTSTWGSQRATQTAVAGGGSGSDSGSCDSSIGEEKCGSTCCGAAYVCSNGQCIIGSSSIWATATATPPVRGTSSGLSTVTETGNPTTTQAFDTPVNTDGSPAIGVKAPDDDGLSGGAIAGIVIGTIAGVALLLLVCACLCCRGALVGLAACLGIGRKRNQDDRYSQGGKPEGRTWFGAKPPAQSEAGGEKKSRWGGLATIGIVLGALALCLGLKRHRDREHDEKSSYSYPSSYYYSDYYTNSSMSCTSQLPMTSDANWFIGSASSDRRTRDTRRTRDSRGTRATRDTRDTRRTRRSRARSGRS